MSLSPNDNHHQQSKGQNCFSFEDMCSSWLWVDPQVFFLYRCTHWDFRAQLPTQENPSQGRQLNLNFRQTKDKFFNISMSRVLHRKHIEKVLLIYLRFKFNWAIVILFATFGNPTPLSSHLFPWNVLEAFVSQSEIRCICNKLSQAHTGLQCWKRRRRG